MLREEFVNEFFYLLCNLKKFKKHDIIIVCYNQQLEGL